MAVSAALGPLQIRHGAAQIEHSYVPRAGWVGYADMSVRSVVVTGWVVVVAAILWAGYAVLWVNEILFSPGGGDTFWRSPLLAGALVVTLAVSVGFAVVLGVRRLQNDGNPSSVIAFSVSVGVAALSALPLPFLALVGIS